MEPLRFFIAKLRIWHFAAAVAFSLIFVIGINLINDQAIVSASSLLSTLCALVAIPVMIFTLAFFSFAHSTDKFAASALFPSIFAVHTAFFTTGLVILALEEADAPIILFLLMGMVLSLISSGITCATIASRQRQRGR